MTWVSEAGKFFVFGGSDDETGEEFNDVFAFDPSTSSWEKGTRLSVLSFKKQYEKAHKVF